MPNTPNDSDSSAYDGLPGISPDFGEQDCALTDLKRAEEARAFLAAIVESSDDSIITIDFEGRITTMNPAAERLYGYPSAEALGKPLGMLTLPAGLAEVVANVDRIRQQQTVETFEMVRVHKDGAELWLSVSLSPVKGDRRQLIGIAMIARDITPRRDAEEALRESEERMRLVVENAREYAIFSMNLDRVITSWNAGAKRILGYSQEEAIGQPGDIIFTHEDRAAHAPEHEAAQAIAEGRASDERWHLRKDGSRFWGSGVMMSMHDVRGEAIGLVKVFRDHTEQLLAKRALEQSLRETESARAEAEAAGRAKDHFLAVLSHELRTPLTPVLMSIDTLMLRDDLPAQVVEGLDMIQRNVGLEAQFIDELLDITRISRGKFELSREPMDLHAAIRSAAEIAAPDIEGKAQQLQFALEARKHELSGDFKRLQQVFWNLLKNASKFTPERGEITIRSRNELAASGGGSEVIVEVVDSGIGFDAEAAERIFDAFTQANESITQEFGGLGLGLAISKATIDAHGGTIRGTSSGAGKGATFTISLPLSEP